MKKLFKSVRDWFYWNSEAIVVAAVVVFAIVGIGVLIAMLVNGCVVNGNVEWVANPSNPASPVNNILP